MPYFEFSSFAVSFFVSSALIGFIMLLKRALANHISTEWHYNMRFLFLAVLILPFVPARHFDLSGLFNKILGDAAINGNLPAITPDEMGNRLLSGGQWLEDFSLSVNRAATDDVCRWLFCVWLAGIFIFTVITLICNRRIWRIKKTALPITDENFTEIFEQCKTRLKITKNIVFCGSSLTQTPMATGIIKTYVVFPLKNFSRITAEDIKHITLHELWHYKSGDIFFNYVMCFLQIIYWFNPLVYMAFKEIRNDREIACDASVLRILERRDFLGYGMTIINLAEGLSRPVPLTLAADMAGGKKQIARRIEKIASHTQDSTGLRFKSLGIFLIAMLLILTQLPKISAMSYDNGKFNFLNDRNTVYEDLSVYFDGYEGSFVLYDLQRDIFSVYNKNKSLTRVSPDSTYKIYSALVALELGVIGDGDSTLDWNGTAYPFQSWNKPHDLTSAMRDSVSWYFQDLDAHSGYANLKTVFKDIGYGNHDLSGGLSNYWMESSLLISPVEQVRVLTDFYTGKLAFGGEHIATVKETLKLSEKNGTLLSGKTGTGIVNGRTINGWFVGYVEKDGNTFLFAVNIQGGDNASGSAAAEIAVSILTDKSILY